MRSFDDDLIVTRKPTRESTAERSASVGADGPTTPRTTACVLRLQRAIGNAGVAQLLEGDEDRQSVEAATNAGGKPLDANTRVQMERSIGADFSSVRVHTGGGADTSARQLGAHAYTVGEDIVFATGRYDPESPVGQRTLAHELTHVVQQRSGPVDGTETGGGVKVSHPSDPYERAAEAMADKVVGANGSVQRAANDDGHQAVQMLAVQREGTEDEEVAAE